MLKAEVLERRPPAFAQLPGYEAPETKEFLVGLAKMAEQTA